MAQTTSLDFSVPTLIIGAPGTGKTSLLIDKAVEYMEAGNDPAGLLVLTPSRVSATRFREAFSSRTTRTLSAAPTRAWSAYAFDILRRAHIEGLLPGLEFSPKLLSGPEQDVMLKELLKGHAEGQGAVILWPEDLQEALGTHGFRHEIRDLFDRMAEYDVSAQELETLSQEMNQPAWAAAAKLYREYQNVRQLRMPHAFDPSGLIHRASKVLVANPDFLAAERDRLQLVLIDDFQEATPSIYQLLNVLVGVRGTEVSSTKPPLTLLTACPDTTVQGFRGARPDNLKNLPTLIPAIASFQLETSYRMPSPIAHSWKDVARRLPQLPGAPVLRTLQQPETPPEALAMIPTGDDGALLDHEKYRDPQPTVEAHTLDTASAEAALIAQMILEDHLFQGKSYGKSAVIVRNSSDVGYIKRMLTSLGIPVKTAASLVPVRDEPAARPFLDALALIVHARKVQNAQPQDLSETDEATHERAEDRWGLGAETAVALLTSRLGGASAMEIRRLRQRLRADELRAGGSRHSDDLLVQALLEPGSIPDKGAGIAVRRVARVLEAGLQALDAPGANAETVLWALWEASGLAKTWREASTKLGATAERAHRDLDAMIGLFEAANRYVDQMPGATAEQFLDYIDSQDLPMDTLADRAVTHEAVEIMTAALAAGREWNTVYVAGIQDGSWPNTTIRGSLLNTQLLIDTLEEGQEAARHISLATRSQLNRFDEFRLFSTAISRASNKLVLTAVNSVEEIPSELLGIASPYLSEDDSVRPNTEVRRPMTLRALIAELRQQAEKQDTDPLRADAAARLLHQLNQPENTAGVKLPGVDPSSWWGLLPLSSTAPTFPEETRIPISPSRVETIHRSPLDWFVAAARAEAATDAARSIGTLVHALAEEMPEAPGHVLEEELVKRFAQLKLAPGWETDLLLENAKTMVRKFASYVVALPEKGRELVGVEGAFSVVITAQAHEVLLSGRVDRLETNALGKFVVVDLKTGKSKPKKAELEKHPQLAAYQVALEAGAGEQMKQMMAARDAGEKIQLEPLSFEKLTGDSGGAYLLQVGDKNKKYGEQSQEALGETDTWAIELITRAADLIATSYLQSRHTAGNDYAFGCRLPDICPICSRGRQVTQGDQ